MLETKLTRRVEANQVETCVKDCCWLSVLNLIMLLFRSLFYDETRETLISEYQAVKIILFRHIYHFADVDAILYSELDLLGVRKTNTTLTVDIFFDRIEGKQNGLV